VAGTDSGHYALGSLAQVRMSQNRFDDAVARLQQRYDAAPHASNLFALAESAITDNANHELMSYYTDFAHQPEKALEIARTELTRRHDVYTLDCYAWALAVGVKDPKILNHASVIAAQLKQESTVFERP
jgi:hypothetical protein